MIPVVFDLDGTLADSAPDMRAALNAVMAARGLAGFSDAETRGFIGHGVPVLIRRAIAARGQPDAVFADWRDAYMAAYAEGICIETRLYPGVATVLDAMAGRVLAVCTNKPQALAEALIGRLGLAGRFAVVLGGDTDAGRKPDPGPLHAVAARLGAGRAVMVGDSMADAGAAQAAGWPMALFTGGYRDRAADAIPADVRFDDWAQFPAALRAVGA